MAKIDISKIEGYADMSAEEKLAALEGLEIPEPDYSGFVRKEVFDKTASEAADFKRKLRERMTEEEAAQAKAAEEREKAAADLAAIQAELNQLRTEKLVGENMAKFLGLGYGEKLARETAEAMVNGETDIVFRNHAKFLAEHEKTIRAELLRDTPKPPAGNGEATPSKTDVKKLSLAEKQKLFTENPEQYKEIYNTKEE